MLIEIKDGDTFDTKKVAGEVESLLIVKEHLIKNRKIKDVSVYYCSFNARDKKQIENGTKNLLPENSAMTGKELCELLGLDFDKIVQERKSQQKENFDYFMKEIKKI